MGALLNDGAFVQNAWGPRFNRQPWRRRMREEKEEGGEVMGGRGQREERENEIQALERK